MKAYVILAAIMLSWPIAKACAAGLEGYWYGEEYELSQGMVRQRIMNFRSDGTFAIEFREYVRCTLVSSDREAGRWELRGNINTTVTTTINGERVDDLYDTYVYEILDNDFRRYRDQQSGELYTSPRVTAAFDFPGCNPTPWRGAIRP